MDKHTLSRKKLTVFAPAKINLYLHVTGRRKDDYHTLDSLVCFADIGDSITIEPHQGFALQIDGPFADQLDAADRKTDETSTNLVVRAALSLSKIAWKTPDIKITLTKNLPVASGIGGGSSNAAATLWALQDWWSLPRNAAYLAPLMQKLGADVAACMACKPLRMRGIGEQIDPVDLPLEIPIVLINPLKPCPTASVFAKRQGPFSSADIKIPAIKTSLELCRFLEKIRNDLTLPAISTVPEIANIIAALEIEKSCRLARMSGSGATCFGLFDTDESAQKAASVIAAENPDWWVQHGHLNRVERY